jgi:hypothetical protein
MKGRKRLAFTVWTVASILSGLAGIAICSWVAFFFMLLASLPTNKYEWEFGLAQLILGLPSLTLAIPVLVCNIFALAATRVLKGYDGAGRITKGIAISGWILGALLLADHALILLLLFIVFVCLPRV